MRAIQLLIEVLDKLIEVLATVHKIYTHKRLFWCIVAVERPMSQDVEPSSKGSVD